MVQQIVRKRPRMPRTHSKAGSNPQGAKISVENFKVNRRVSTDRLYRWRWSPCRLLVDPRWLHLWSSSSTLRVEGRNIPYSTEIRKEDWRLWERQFKQTFVRFLEKIHKIHSTERKPPRGYMLSGERLTKIQTTTRPDHVWPEVWTRLGEGAQSREKQEWAKKKPKLDKARRLGGIYFIDQTTENTQKFAKMQEENWKDFWLPRCRVKYIPSIVLSSAKPKIGNEKEFEINV